MAVSMSYTIYLSSQPTGKKAARAILGRTITTTDSSIKHSFLVKNSSSCGIRSVVRTASDSGRWLEMTTLQLTAGKLQ